MPLPTPELFFNLKTFSHAMVFGRDEPVWKALEFLPFYLGSMLARMEPYRGNAFDGFDNVSIGSPKETRIAASAHIGPYVRIEGRVVIEEGVIIESGAMIVGPALVSSGSFIGHQSYVRHSILFPGVRLLNRNTVRNSLLGWDTELCGHVITPHRVARGNVLARLPHGPCFETGLCELGLIAGDGCFFGSAVKFHSGDMYVPGTRLE